MLLRILFILNAILLIKAQSNNIVFDLADLTVDYETDAGTITLEAFKSTTNDLIIQKKEQDNYGQLNWLSIGQPKLVASLDKNNQKNLFIFRPEGFYTRVEMLTAQHRALFKDVVRRKYNINITPDQIVSLIPSRFECKIKFNVDNERILINGKVTQMNNPPLKLEFDAPKGSKERFLFEERLKDEGNSLDLDIHCVISSKGQSYKLNTLVITGQQINQLGIVDELFGPANDVYVTRQQMSDLSSALYHKLNIMEDYQIPETQFTSNFIDDFIKQTSNIIYQNVKIDEVLSGLSQYDLREDLKPNVIKQELSKVFVVNTTGSKSRIVLDNDFKEYLKTHSNTNTQGSGKGGDIFGLLDVSLSASHVVDKSSEWELKNKSLNDQLYELNSHYNNYVEWEKNGNILVPKSVRVCKLSKASFSKNLIFSRVRKEYYEAPFIRPVVFNTHESLSFPQFLEDNARKIVKLEAQLGEFESKLNDLDGKFQESDHSLYTSIKNAETILNGLSSAINDTTRDIQLEFETKYEQLNNAVNHVNTKIANEYNELRTQISLRAIGCRICFKETEGSSQCQGNRHSCSEITSLSNQSPGGWTAGFRDDTDNRAGGCHYHWVVYCQYA